MEPAVLHRRLEAYYRAAAAADSPPYPFLSLDSLSLFPSDLAARLGLSEIAAAANSAASTGV